MKLHASAKTVRDLVSQVKSVILLGVACLLLAGIAFSQGIATGSISGTVIDPSGAVVPGASITAVNSATGQTITTQTNDVGYFTLRNVPPGSY